MPPRRPSCPARSRSQRPAWTRRRGNSVSFCQFPPWSAPRSCGARRAASYQRGPRSPRPSPQAAAGFADSRNNRRMLERSSAERERIGTTPRQSFGGQRHLWPLRERIAQFGAGSSIVSWSAPGSVWAEQNGMAATAWAASQCGFAYRAGKSAPRRQASPLSCSNELCKALTACPSIMAASMRREKLPGLTNSWPLVHIVELPVGDPADHAAGLDVGFVRRGARKRAVGFPPKSATNPRDVGDLDGPRRNYRAMHGASR